VFVLFVTPANRILFVNLYCKKTLKMWLSLGPLVMSGPVAGGLIKKEEKD
jgi:hypothetical protein